MLRKIVQIDENKCNGCGLCIGGCHEGALQLIDGKVKLITDSYCDGLGACLPECPTGAIQIIEREAAQFDEAAVEQHIASRKAASEQAVQPISGGCPGSQARVIKREASALRQWPCQLQLVPVQAPYFDQADILIAADCTAFACADMHQRFMQNKVTLIGCPKLDAVQYAEKIEAILKSNAIRSVTVVRMEVPCCGGLVYAVKEALLKSGKEIDCDIVIVGVDGQIQES